MPTGRRRAVLIGVAAAVVVVAAGAIAAWRLTGRSGNVEGSTTGFVDTATTPQVPVGSWPEYGHDSARTRANATLTIRPPYRRLWRHDARSLLEFPPAIADGRVYVGSNDGQVFALDLTTGRKLWHNRLMGLIAASPAVADGRVYFTTKRKGRLVALDAATGTKLWFRPLGAPSESSPLVIGGGIYVGNWNGDVLRLDARTGRTVWRAKAAGAIKSSLAESGANVIAADYGGEVRAFAKSNGRLVWSRQSPGERFKGPGRFYAGPAVAYGRIYIGNVNNRIVALQADTGRVAWVRAAKDYVYSSAAVADRTVFVGSYDHNLYALDAVTGNVRWAFDTRERISGSASVVGDIVYVSTLAPKGALGTTFGLDVATGKPVWTFPDGRYSPAVAVDDTLVIVGREVLYGLTPR